MLHTPIMSLPCSVYPLHSSFFTRFSRLSFQHDISPHCCLTQSGLLDNKCASCTAQSLHQLVSAIHFIHPTLAGLPGSLTPHRATERHKAGCVCSHCNQPPPPHATCRTPMCDCPWEGGQPTWQKKSFRGWWKFAIFPFASSRIIRNMLVTIMVKNQMFLARGGVDNASGLWMKVKLSVALKPFYIFNNKQTNRTANMDLGHSSCEFLSAGTSGLLWPRPIPNIQFTPTSTSLPYRCEIWLLSERYLCGNQQY